MDFAGTIGNSEEQLLFLMGMAAWPQMVTGGSSLRMVTFMYTRTVYAFDISVVPSMLNVWGSGSWLSRLAQSVLGGS